MIKQMNKFITKYKKTLLLSTIFAYICFGFMLTHFSISIDEDTWILPEQLSNMWFLQGRFTVWLFDLLFTINGNFTPFLWDFLAVSAWHISGILFAYSFWADEDVTPGKLFFFCSYYTSLPFVVGEMLSFSSINFQTSLAMVAVALAFNLSLRLLENLNKKTGLAVILLLIYAMGTYQATVCVYITAVVGYCFLHHVISKRDGLSQTVLRCGGVCLLSTLFYYGINYGIGVLVGTAGYLSDNYSGWGSGNIMKEIALAFANIPRVLFAISYQDVYIYGGAVIRCITILFVVFSVLLFVKRKGLKEKGLILFFSVALCAAPFTLYLALATYRTHGRMLLALPLMGAIQMYFIFISIKRKGLKTAAIVLAGYLLFLNARNMNLIYFYDSIAYERDCEIASQIMYDIKRSGIDYSNKPIAFIGMVPQEEVAIKISGTLGGSLFTWDDGNMVRMRDFLNARGYAVEAPNADQRQKALSQTAAMKTWPQEGSVQELDDVIVVYLSEPEGMWYSTNNLSPN